MSIVFCLCLAPIVLQAQPVIADHTVIDRYSTIPDEYFPVINSMLLNIAGESHSRGYRYGLELLAAQDSRLSVSVDRDDGPEAPTTNHLRVFGSARWPNGNWDVAVGEEDLWTTQWAVDVFVNTIKYQAETANNPFTAMGFGWCYDMIDQGLTGSADPVYGCRWAGRSEYYNGTGSSISFSGSPGWGQWGLDNADSISLGGPRVTMNMYIRAVEAARKASSETEVFFTTGVVDYKSTSYPSGREDLYQNDVKHEYIRDYVRNSSDDLYLFDYADILCWSEDGVERTETWEGHTYQKIVLDYVGDYDGGEGGCHISESACLRLGKAMVWMLARMAGWDGGVTSTREVSDQDLSYNLYPNPARERVTITNDLGEIADIQLMDNSGRVLLSKPNTSLPAEIDLTGLNLSRQIYLLKINNRVNVKVLRLVML